MTLRESAELHPLPSLHAGEQPIKKVQERTFRHQYEDRVLRREIRSASDPRRFSPAPTRICRCRHCFGCQNNRDAYPAITAHSAHNGLDYRTSVAAPPPRFVFAIAYVGVAGLLRHEDRREEETSPPQPRQCFIELQAGVVVFPPHLSSRIAGCVHLHPIGKVKRPSRGWTR